MKLDQHDEIPNMAEYFQQCIIKTVLIQNLTACFVLSNLTESCNSSTISPFLLTTLGNKSFNPIPHMPILGSSNSATNKDMPKILKNEDTIF